MTSENRRILIIDDERPILLTLEALLGRHGYHPEVAANAATGMRLLQSKSPALVLLDLQLPDRDGISLAADLAVHDVDVVLCTHDPGYAFAFVLSPNGEGLLLQGPILGIAWTLAVSAVAVAALAVATGGWLLGPARPPERVRTGSGTPRSVSRRACRSRSYRGGDIRSITSPRLTRSYFFGCIYAPAAAC